MAGQLTAATLDSGTSGTPPVFNASGTQIGTLCRAWVSFNGGNGNTGGAINAQFNVSSVTRNTTGDYTINFTNALSSASYAVAFGSQPITAGAGSSGQNTWPIIYPTTGVQTTTSLRIANAYGNATSLFDTVITTLAVFR